LSSPAPPSVRKTARSKCPYVERRRSTGRRDGGSKGRRTRPESKTTVGHQSRGFTPRDPLPSWSN
jgi:hypothetical protein